MDGFLIREIYHFFITSTLLLRYIVGGRGATQKPKDLKQCDWEANAKLFFFNIIKELS